MPYSTRGAFSHQRLSLLDPDNTQDDLVYTLKMRYVSAESMLEKGGSEAIQLSPSELLGKLVGNRYLMPSE